MGLCSQLDFSRRRRRHTQHVYHVQPQPPAIEQRFRHYFPVHRRLTAAVEVDLNMLFSFFDCIFQDEINALLGHLEGHVLERRVTCRGITIGAAQVAGGGEEEGDVCRLRVAVELGDRATGGGGFIVDAVLQAGDEIDRCCVGDESDLAQGGIDEVSARFGQGIAKSSAVKVGMVVKFLLLFQHPTFPIKHVCFLINKSDSPRVNHKVIKCRSR